MQSQCTSRELTQRQIQHDNGYTVCVETEHLSYRQYVKCHLLCAYYLVV